MPLDKRTNIARIIFASTISLTSLFAQAAPEPLNIDKTQKSVNHKHLQRVYAYIPDPGLSTQETRLAILLAMRDNPKKRWLLEGEGDGYIDARFDYRRRTIINRIEYSKQGIQLKYLAASDSFECQNNQNGICYKSHGAYYKYSGKLKTSVERELEAQVAAAQYKIEKQQQ
ncbi:Uncharacterised protein [BD1-7 clade bacterium]|uniref:Uncharacterized protein n=1 Tax=BD1-7 clade bacterium TaxID=2029982 RepID=A0A5S9P857_9GAMM|nr:Uncharacterised protein [BD1-7 clade bacterium]